MVARPADRRSSANAGELDKTLAGRVDLKQYYSGGLRYKHVEPVPQSGFRDMGGTIELGKVRPRITTLAQSGVTATPGPHTGTQTVWQANVTGAVAAVHVDGLRSGAITVPAWVEVFAGGVWLMVGTARDIDATPISHTFARPPGQPFAGVTAVRIRVNFGSSDTATLTGVTVIAETAIQDAPRYESLRHDSGDRYFLAVTAQWMEIFRDDVRVASIYLPTVTLARLPELGFYAENATIGLFHRTMRTIRIRRAGSAFEWTVDDWPYQGIPDVDLGGNYPKTADQWTVTVRWAQNRFVTVDASVNGETTTGVKFTDAGGTVVNIANANWPKFANDYAAAINALPSIQGGVTATANLYDPGPQDGAGDIIVTFGGASIGEEYQLDARVTNTTLASALASHTQIGKTDFEPLFSAVRGWPGGASLVQDRLGYFDINAERGALALSQVAEYFNLNIKGAGANRARLDRLRAGQTAERILAVMDASYLLVFSDQAVHFAPNRVIKADEPLNLTQAAGVGIVPYTEPVELEQKIYYVGFNDDEDNRDGHQILSLSYSEVLTNFEALPESLLASHLVQGVMRTKRQASTADQDASKMWVLRRDGRLVACQVIQSEEILGMCEFMCAAGGLAREIEVDKRNRLRLCVERGGELRHERQDRSLFLQATIHSTCDLAGLVSGLDLHEGREVWAVAEGYVLGPFTVTGGTIDLGEHFTGTVQVGLWAPPVYESMPFYYVRRDDTIVKRPGRIPVAHLDLIETTSIAVGANGEEPEDVDLLNAQDPVDAPMPPKSGPVTVSGMLGSKVGTTLVITQTRPGRLQVRDYLVEEAL
jgi:hypothetical protein